MWRNIKVGVSRVELFGLDSLKVLSNNNHSWFCHNLETLSWLTSLVLTLTPLRLCRVLSRKPLDLTLTTLSRPCLHHSRNKVDLWQVYIWLCYGNFFRGQRHSFKWFWSVSRLSVILCMSLCRVYIFDTSVTCLYFLLAHFSITNYVLCSLSIGSGGTKFEIFSEHVAYFHSMLWRWAWLLDKVDKNCLQVQKMHFLDRFNYLIDWFVTDWSPRAERHIKHKVYRLPCSAWFFCFALAEFFFLSSPWACSLT